jgi:hypothetical protein
VGKEETYKDRLHKEGRDEDLFAPKKREPRGFVLHGRESQGDESSTPESAEQEPQESPTAHEKPSQTRKAA